MFEKFSLGSLPDLGFLLAFSRELGNSREIFPSTTGWDDFSGSLCIFLCKDFHTTSRLKNFVVNSSSAQITEEVLIGFFFIIT